MDEDEARMETDGAPPLPEKKAAPKPKVVEKVVEKVIDNPADVSLEEQAKRRNLE